MPTPKQKPGKSEQEVETPTDFFDAVCETFGDPILDFAANKANAKAAVWLGPGGEYEDALADNIMSWANLLHFHGGRYDHRALAWLNPPFSNITPWVELAAKARPFGHVLVLVPAAVGANWYRDWVANFADVYSVGRMKFVGHANQYPKDLLLLHYWNLSGGKFKRWEWNS